MKIAIQGHSARGHEVIQILESLGGKKRDDLTGRMFSQYYFINCYGDIDLDLKVNLLDYKFYTLEEFEKEFPFKIGDKVRDCSDDEIGVITDLTYIDNMLIYNVDFVDSGQAFMPTEQLKPYKKMKEERNVTLTLDKAKEWYKKGGELREIALQAFAETELNPLPRSWEEFCTIYSKVDDKEYFIDSNSNIAQVNSTVLTHSRVLNADKNICPSKKSAEAHLALIQLEQLRNCWWNGWEPEWKSYAKYSIKNSRDGLSVIISYNVAAFLTFPTIEMAEEFLECFKDLIEQAGDLI